VAALGKKETHDALTETQSAIIAAMDRREERDKEAAWRIAVGQWLVKKRHISMSESPEVSPRFPSKWSHN
jgi:hypothetical protein